GQYAGTSRARLVGIALALLYVVSPIDLLPELLLPFVGLGDDAVVISWIAASLINETESFLGWEGERARTVRGHVVV
ncbi:MAG TPA: YkvA family protein, partial [Dermatophilaceae bacterium]|nr:YkvA family protein [Dermatophilaceae bacterium]